MSLGAFEFVNKPIKKEEFELIVHHALSKRRPGKPDRERTIMDNILIIDDNISLLESLAASGRDTIEGL